jgi:hypothetical protein
LRKMESNSVRYEGSETRDQETRGQEPIGRQKNQQGAGSFPMGTKNCKGELIKLVFRWTSGFTGRMRQ